MAAISIKTTVKVIGTNGQISLGKEFAGRQILVEERETGVWLIRTASIIPDNELWLHTPEAKNDMQQALAYAKENEPVETSDLDAFIRKLSCEEKQ